MSGPWFAAQYPAEHLLRYVSSILVLACLLGFAVYQFVKWRREHREANSHNPSLPASRGVEGGDAA